MTFAKLPLKWPPHMISVLMAKFNNVNFKMEKSPRGEDFQSFEYKSRLEYFSQAALM